MKHSFDVAYIIASIPALLDGLLMTTIVSAISIVLAIIIGIAGASARIFDTQRTENSVGKLGKV